MPQKRPAKVCAYCGKPSPLTAEHIWPKGIIKRTQYNLRYSAKAGKTFSGDITIKDVCGTCNNGPLSKLDDYICELFDNYFHKTPEPNKSINFRYSHEKLLRWLLKISYNSSRLTQIDADLLATYAPILIAEDPISPIHVGAFVTTATYTYVQHKDTGQIRKVEPHGTRCGPLLDVSSEHQSWCSLRAVTINGFMFTLLTMRQPTIDENDWKKISSIIPGVPLQPSGHIRIPPPNNTAFDLYKGVEFWPAPKGRG